MAFLEVPLSESSEVMEIGTLFNSIRDDELRSRCSDLLSAPDKFDRPINQATQVLEDRIRERSRTNAGLIGADLVNKVIKSDPKKTVLLLSDDDGEQEGFSHIIRGMVGAFRNPTHRGIGDHFSREEGLKACGFADILLQVIDEAKVVGSP